MCLKRYQEITGTACRRDTSPKSLAVEQSDVTVHILIGRQMSQVCFLVAGLACTPPVEGLGFVDGPGTGDVDSMRSGFWNKQKLMRIDFIWQALGSWPPHKDEDG